MTDDEFWQAMARMPDLQALVERAGRRYAASIGEEYIADPFRRMREAPHQGGYPHITPEEWGRWDAVNRAFQDYETRSATKEQTMMTEQEIQTVAARLVAACHECDAGRLPEKDLLDRAFTGKSDHEIMRIHIAMARLQGRDVVAIHGSGKVVGTSSDLAEDISRWAVRKQH